MTDNQEHGIGQAVVPTDLRVLVVDDNDDVAECLVMLLRRLGHRPRGCCSGRDCMECLFEFRPEVILLDISMPVQDGFDICRQIRHTDGFEGSPIIACSALDWYMVKDRAEKCQFTSYLRKPVSANQLQAAIESAAFNRLVEGPVTAERRLFP